MNTETEILTKVNHIINNLEFEAQIELLADIDRLINNHNPKTPLENFIEEINSHFTDSFSNDFLSGIFELSIDDFCFIVNCYFKHKEEKNVHY